MHWQNFFDGSGCQPLRMADWLLINYGLQQNQRVKRTKMVSNGQVALFPSAFQGFEEMRLPQKNRLPKFARLIVLLVLGCFKLD